MKKNNITNYKLNNASYTIKERKKNKRSIRERSCLKRK